MANDITLNAEEAKRLKNDTAFQQFVGDVRKVQIEVFANSAAEQVERREEAHAIIRALKLIEMELDAAIGAEKFLNRKG